MTVGEKLKLSQEGLAEICGVGGSSTPLGLPTAQGDVHFKPLPSTNCRQISHSQPAFLPDAEQILLPLQDQLSGSDRR